MVTDDDVIMIDSIPFHMKQPTEKIQEIYTHYAKLMKVTLGQDLLATHPVGSSAIPGMPGAASVDVILFMNNFPPTDQQIEKLKSIDVVSHGQAPHTENDIMFYNEGKRFDTGEPVKLHHLGQVVFHFLHHGNQWARNAMAFVEYLKRKQEAFNKYRDVKIRGAELQKGEKSEDIMEVFVRYKRHKNAMAVQLVAEAGRWAFEDGNYELPKDIE